MHTIERSTSPFDSHWMELPAGRMHYVDEGRGEPIVFVHGTPTWSYEWRHAIRALAGASRCIAPDHLGFGLSDRPRNFAYSPEAHAESFAEFVTRLNPEPFTLVVHDFGGPIALPFCFKHPERVSRIVLINTWMWSFTDDPDMTRKARIAGGGFGRFMYRHVNFSLRVLMPSAYGDRKKLTPEIHARYLDRFPDAGSRGLVLWPLAHALLGSTPFYDGLWQRRHGLRGRPALVIWGMKDSAFRPHQLARWIDVLPVATVCRIDSAGHWPHEEEPGAVVEALRDFLART